MYSKVIVQIVLPLFHHTVYGYINSVDDDGHPDSIPDLLVFLPVFLFQTFHFLLHSCIYINTVLYDFS